MKPDPLVDALWFTKGTVERFVRNVSTLRGSVCFQKCYESTSLAQG